MSWGPFLWTFWPRNFLSQGFFCPRWFLVGPPILSRSKPQLLEEFVHQLHLIVKKHLSFCFSFVAVIQFVLEGLTDWWNVHLMPKPKSIKSFMLRSKLLSFLVQYLGSKYFALRKTFVSAPASLTHWSQNPFLGSKIQFLSYLFTFLTICLHF